MKKGKAYFGLGVFFIGIILFFGMTAFSLADEGPLLEEAEQETEISDFQEMEPKAAAEWEIKPVKGRSPFNLDVGADIKYDSNVFEYSKSDMDERDAGTNPDRFSGVRSINDVVTRLYGIARVKSNIFDFGTTTLGAGLKGDIYGKNPSKSYLNLQATARQAIGKKHLLRIGYDLIPSYFVRTLYARNEPRGQRYKKAAYMSNAVHLKYWNGISDVFSWWMRYTYEYKDYNKFFPDRDTSSNRLTTTLRIQPEDWIKFNPYFRYSWNNARGRIGKEYSMPDISRNGFDTGTEVWLFPDEPFTVIGRYDFRWDYYTTSQSATEDPYHSGRTQGRNRITGKLFYAISKSVNLFTEYQYTTRSVNTKAAGAGATVLEGEAILGYDKHVARLGASIAF